MHWSRSMSSRAPSGRTACAIAAVLWLVACTGEEDASAPDAPPEWPTGDLVAVAAPASDVALVATRAGRILRSVDGGETWSRARTPASDGLSDVAMVDADRGWAVGPGAILRTDDGGAHWERQRLPGRAADWPLVAVAAVDAEHAVAIGEDGRWLTTNDGGGVWRAPARERDAEPTDPGRFAAVACAPVPPSKCWAVGDRVVEIDPARNESAVRGLADAAGLSPFRFRLGGVELSDEDVDRLRAAARRLAPRSVDWQVEATVTREERRRFAEDQDPSALFDRIEARAGEIVGHLEAAGVAGERITVVGAPPWGYEDHLDDDPAFLDRYWQGRLAPVPSASVRASESVDLRAVIARGDGILVSDAEGRIFEGEGEVAPLAFVERAAPHGLLAMARTGAQVVAVGRQGGIFVLRRGRPGLAVAPATVGPGGALFETLRDVAFVPGSEIGWAVGDAGRMARTGDGGDAWQRLEAPKVAESPSE